MSPGGDGGGGGGRRPRRRRRRWRLLAAALVGVVSLALAWGGACVCSCLSSPGDSACSCCEIRTTSAAKISAAC